MERFHRNGNIPEKNKKHDKAIALIPGKKRNAGDRERENVFFHFNQPVSAFSCIRQRRLV